MSFLVKPPSSLGRSLLSWAQRVKSSVKRARINRGYLQPLASSRQVAQDAFQKGLAGIAETAREGDKAAQIELKHRKGDFH